MHCLPIALRRPDASRGWCRRTRLMARRRLYLDPGTPADTPFNYEGLLKLIKKLDKDLGP